MSGASAPVSRLISVVLPAPFGPTMPIRSPRRIAQSRGPRTIARSPKVLADALGLDHQLARTARASGERHVDGADRAALLSPLAGADRARSPSAAHVALAPRGDAVAEPVLLRGDLAVELVAVALLLLEHRVAPGLEGGEALVEPAGDAAVEPDRRAATGVSRKRRSWLMRTSAERERRQLAFQPLDGRQVEVVGRLVEQQDVGLAARAPAPGRRGGPRRRRASRAPRRR